MPKVTKVKKRLGRKGLGGFPSFCLSLGPSAISRTLHPPSIVIHATAFSVLHPKRGSILAWGCQIEPAWFQVKLELNSSYRLWTREDWGYVCQATLTLPTIRQTAFQGRWRQVWGISRVSYLSPTTTTHTGSHRKTLSLQAFIHSFVHSTGNY